MLKLEKNNGLTRMQLAKKAIKKIPLYENNNDRKVKVPFLDMSTKNQRYIEFTKLEGEWTYTGIVD